MRRVEKMVASVGGEQRPGCFKNSSFPVNQMAIEIKRNDTHTYVCNYIYIYRRVYICVDLDLYIYIYTVFMFMC